MSAISLKSITGITSITTPAGVDNQLTLHTNDTTQRVKVTESGVEIAGVTTTSGDLFVDGDLVLPSSGRYIKIWTGGTQGITLNHGGSFGELDNLTGMMRIKASQIKLSNRFGNLDMLTCNSFGSVDLFHNNILRFTTTGYGVSTTGLEVVGVSTFSDGIHLKADVDGSSSTKRIYIGAGDDLTLFHDSANSYLQNHTGDLIIGDTNHTYLRGYTSDKSAALFFNNSNKIQTTNTGVVVSGILTATDIVSTTGQLSNRNKIQNGAMNVSQRFDGDAHTPSSTSRIYTLDRWAYWSNQASKTTIQQVEDAPVGFKYSSKCTVASAYTISSGDWFGYMTHIEGQDLYDLELGNSNAKAFTLSFYVKSSVAGTWAGAIRTKGASPDHSYPYNYTINSANTWEKKTITIPGPTSGTWVGGRSEGMCVWFDLGSGSGYHATANQWHGSNRTGPSASPFIANAGATWQITGVQLEKGSVATEYEHRSAADETSICERYCEVIYGEALDETNEGVMGVGHFYQSARLIGSYQFHTQKRVGHNGETTDYGIRNTGGYVKGDVADVQGLNSGASWGNSNSVKFRMNRSACRVDLRGLSGTQGHAGEWRVQNSTKLIFSAEFG